MTVKLWNCLGHPEGGTVMRLLGMSPDVVSFIRKADDQLSPAFVHFYSSEHEVHSERRSRYDELLSAAAALPGPLRVLPNEEIRVEFDADKWALTIDAR